MFEMLARFDLLQPFGSRSALALICVSIPVISCIDACMHAVCALSTCARRQAGSSQQPTTICDSSTETLWTLMYCAKRSLLVDLSSFFSFSSSPSPLSSIYLRMELCLAPITLTSSFQWVSLTLNPYHEANDPSAMVEEDGFILDTFPHWEFGADNTGNVMNKDNILKLWERAKELNGVSLCAVGMLILTLMCEQVDLFTGDGSVDCQYDPNEQENITAQLHYCEAVAGLGCLSEGPGCVDVYPFLLFVVFLWIAFFAHLLWMPPHFASCI